MKISAIVRALVAAKATPEMILAAVEAAENEQANALEKRREADRERQARKRKRDTCHVTSRDVTVTVPSHARGEDNLQTKIISGQEEKKVTSPSARSSRGSRIPEDFQPDIEAAIAEGVPRHEAERQARSFCDYWRSKPGSGGLKLDWPATWRVWYRRNIPPAHKPHSAGPPKKTTRASMWTEEAIAHGIIDEPDSTTDRLLDASFARGQDQGIVVPLRVAGSTGR